MAMANLLPRLNQLGQELQRITTPFLLFLVSLLLLSIFILFSSSKSGSKLKSPPSPTKLPLIGNLHQLGTLPHRSLGNLSKKHGPLMLLHLGQVPTLVVSSAEMAKEVMKTHDSVFCSRPKLTATNKLVYGGYDIGFSPYGEYWRQLRKLSVQELLSVKRVQQFQYAREEEVGEMVNNIRKACRGQSPINLSEMLIRASGNIMSRCVLGRKIVGENGCWFGELSRTVMTQLMVFSVEDFFPSFRWIDSLTGLTARLNKTFVKADGFLDLLIEEHRTANKEVDSKDFVDILLQCQKDSMLDFKLTRDNLKGILWDMLIGGSDTSSTALEWLMVELLRNSNVMARLQQEVRRVVGKKARVEVSDIEQMDYLKCVIKEALRLHPPGPLLLPRETIAAVELGGYHIPAKTRVLVNAFAIQRDPELWDRPEEFLPERFEGHSVDFKGQDFQFITFGGGRRVCPGMNMAVAAVQYELANLVYWFDWKLPSSESVLAETLDMTEVYGLTVRKNAHLHVVPLLYSP
ncbi:phenylacetaldehyde oxime monooxygenase CYP71AN24-like [Argentina anserina]|uniref:phenylacetaldehyde oxime monooxygenase CYP71AN24-like n=1 Tax=Argentina anserina TaxID=57926 RepID=UPI0021764EAB|nr:phenylacetaldehyde oxime monooxygenase CYP71AN24-like [Potentilla anserina]